MGPAGALASPLLILLALLLLLARHGTDRLQVLPALLIGISLMVHALVGRQRRRRQQLLALRRERLASSSSVAPL